MAEDLNTAQQILQQIQDIMSGLSETVGNIGQTLGAVPEVIGQASGGLTTLAQDAKKVEQNVAAATNSFTTYSGQLSKLFDNLKGLSGSSSEAVNELTKGLVNIGSVALSGVVPVSSAFSTLGKSAGDTGDIIDDKYGKIISKLSSVAQGVLLHAEANKKAEIGLVALHAKAGDLNKEFERQTSGIQSLNNLTNEFANQMEAISISTGTTTAETSGYAKTLLAIPGAYSKIISETPVGSINLLQAAMTVASGTTQDFGDVFGIISQQFKNFGQVGKEPLELMSRMYSVSQNLGLPFEYLNTQIKNTSEQFKYFGDNTNASLRILSGFAPALKASGVGPAGISEIVGNLTNAVGSLDIAQKAFLSAQTGGPGGLQGGYQIDLLLQQGKMDEVFKKMEDSLKKQFGKIVTLEEASRSPEAAGQLTKQVAFLKEGPFGKIAQTDAQAFKILEAFKAGAAPKVEEPTVGQDAFSNVMNQGSALQERHNNLLTIASNHLDRFGSAIDDVSGSVLRNLTGTGGEGRIKEVIAEKTNLSLVNAAQIQPDKTGGAAGVLQSVGKGTTLLGDVAGIMVDSAKGLSESIIKNTNNISQNQKSGLNPSQILNELGPTTTTPFIRPINVAEPNATPINFQKTISQIDPSIQANINRNALLTDDKQKNTKTLGSVTNKDDTLTIMVKSDGVKESQVVAIVRGEIKGVEKKIVQNDRNMAHAGFTGN